MRKHHNVYIEGETHTFYGVCMNLREEIKQLIIGGEQKKGEDEGGVIQENVKVTNRDVQSFPMEGEQTAAKPYYVSDGSYLYIGDGLPIPLKKTEREVPEETVIARSESTSLDVIPSHTSPETNVVEKTPQNESSSFISAGTPLQQDVSLIAEEKQEKREEKEIHEQPVVPQTIPQKRSDAKKRPTKKRRRVKEKKSLHREASSQEKSERRTLRAKKKSR